MANAQNRRPDFRRVVARYPAQGALVRRLLLSDLTFRNVCEDYLLLLDTIVEIEKQAAPRADHDDCARLRAELESDMATLLQNAAGDPPG